MNDSASSVKCFCAQIGGNPLLVQGAGGNASWKEGGTLWIKGSGTWLADADVDDIFVEVDLINLQSELKMGNYSALPQLLRPSSLKPSIETILHASFDFKIVVHLHAVEVLAHLVKKDARELMAHFLTSNFDFVFVDYFKPGFQLAEAVNEALDTNPRANLVLLASHGLVLGGDTIEEVSTLLDCLTVVLKTPTRESTCLVDLQCAKPDVVGYLPVADSEIHLLALDDHLFDMVGQHWALYPDHVVFLGAQANTFQSLHLFKQFISSLDPSQQPPELVFVRGEGVFGRAGFGKSMLAQLRCYYDVICRQTDKSALQLLTQAQVHELLNWDAEKHRLLRLKG